MQTLKIKVEAGLNKFCQRHFGADITKLSLLTGGANMELWAFDCDDRSLVLRRYRGGVTMELGEQSISLEDEAAVIKSINATGIKAPKIIGVLRSKDELGMGFVMERVEGQALPHRLFKDPKYGTALKKLPEEFGETLARIHKSDKLKLENILPTHSPARKLRQIEDIFATRRTSNPVIAAAFNWLHSNLPKAPKQFCLVHGDFRMGNILVDPDGLSSVLDWELAHIGMPESDLAWFCMPSWRFGRYDQTAGGVGTAEELISAYEKHGLEINRDVFQWFLIWSCLSWGASTILMTNFWRDGQDKSLERIVVGTRISEVETDLLLLLEKALGIGAEPFINIDLFQSTSTDGDITSAELQIGVTEYLAKQIIPSSEGAAKFHARVAANALSIATRMTAMEPVHSAATKTRLEQLGHSETSLYGGILSGQIEWQKPEILQHMRLLCLERLALHQPEYAGGKAARLKWMGA